MDVNKAFQSYIALRISLLLIGIILYFYGYFFVVSSIPYVSFLFGDANLYLLSPFIPIIILIAYSLTLYISIEKNINYATYLILLSLVDIFSIPFGTILAIVVIILCEVYFGAKIEKKQILVFVLSFIVLLPIFLYISTPAQPTYYYASPDVMSFGNETGEYIIKIKDYPATQSVEVQSIVVQSVETLGGSVEDSTLFVTNSLLVEIQSNKLASLYSTGYIDAIIPNEKVVRVFDDTFLLNDVKNLLHIDSLPVDGSGIVVAVVDTGINEHINQLERNGTSIVVDKYELYGDYVGEHGTEVACCIASQDVNYPGVARGCNLLDVEVFQNGGYATYWDIMKGWDWVAQWKSQHNVYVICSNSFGCPPDSLGATLLRASLNNMVLKYDIPMIVASGNSVEDRKVMCPGDAEYAFTVGAVDKTNHIAYFSCIGKSVDVVSYGVNINTFDPNGNLATVSGTSFSTPQVAGVFALLSQVKQLSALSMYDIVRDTATDLGKTGFDNEYGYGLVNPVNAYMLISNENINDSKSADVLPIAVLSSIFCVMVVDMRWFK